MSEAKALLVTDVVDSTQLAERLGEHAIAALWAEHDRRARDLLTVWCGREIDRTDGMLLLFDNAVDAAGFALGYQQAMSSLVPAIKARVGLHVGPVVLRRNSAGDVARGAKPLEVDGAAKAIAARVMSVAAGGQILLTAEARQAITDPACRVLSHGHWRLKGVAEPVELFEIGADDAPWRPPPDAEKAYRVVHQGEVWLPAREIRHGLPAERDAFVGQLAALHALSQRIHDGARLVSVMGIGGSGKTRFVIRFGWTWLGDFPGGVWFCDLSAARSLAGIVHAVAVALDVPLGKGDPVVQLGHAIAGRGKCLVILDNFEQLTSHAENSVGRWMDQAAQAVFLVTTQQLLGLQGEQVLPLPALLHADAVALFVRRAEAIRIGWRPDADDAAAIEQLVELLDGLPLAIELAAARSRVMPPPLLLARMGERLKLLVVSGGRPSRQATLRATFDWSWELLSGSDKAALAQLSVFESGFTLESAEAVLDLSADEPSRWSADAVQSLLDKSLIRQLSGTRFDLLGCVQEYAAEHLRSEHRFNGSGPQQLLAAQTRHGHWFAARDFRSAAAAIDEADNLVAACRRAIARDDGECAAGALAGAWAVLNLRGPYEAAVELAEAVCAMASLSDRAAARAHKVFADALVACGRSGQAQYDQALGYARAAGDRHGETEVAVRLAAQHLNHGRNQQARAELAAALAAARELRDGWLQAAAINGFGNLESNEGHLDAARANYTIALQLARDAGDRRMQGTVLGNLSHLNAAIGDLAKALSRCEEGLAIARESKNRYLESSLLCNLGMLLSLLGRTDESCEASRSALTMARELGYVRLESIIQCNLGIALERLGMLEEAQESFEIGLRIACELEDRRMQGQVLGYQGLLHARLRNEEEALRCLDEGETLLRAVSDAFSLGILLCGRVQAFELAGDRSAAVEALARARSIAVETGAGPASELGLALARAEESMPGLADPSAARAAAEPFGEAAR